MERLKRRSFLAGIVSIAVAPALPKIAPVSAFAGLTVVEFATWDGPPIPEEVALLDAYFALRYGFADVSDYLKPPEDGSI